MTESPVSWSCKSSSSKSKQRPEQPDFAGTVNMLTMLAKADMKLKSQAREADAESDDSGLVAPTGERMNRRRSTGAGAAGGGGGAGGKMQVPSGQQRRPSLVGDGSGDSGGGGGGSGGKSPAEGGRGRNRGRSGSKESNIRTESEDQVSC